MANLRSLLMAWRDSEAAKKGIELFRVLPNSAIDDIVRALPKTKDELTSIKGIKEAKFQQYGVAILRMVKDSSGGVSEPTAPDEMQHVSAIVPAPKDTRTLYSVSNYLDVLNRELWRLRACIKGEITSFKFQGSAVYFSLRDNEDGSVLSVFMWMNDFSIAGIELAEGLEVIIEGRSEIYKPSGRFNFRADTIQLVGEGAFKKAYDELRRRLTTEGLFDPAKKRELSDYPVRIGLITSRGGAVIHDFLTNLGRFGFHITFVDVRVEGASAVKDILAALDTLESAKLDALVLVRGGGSLESLQAFNNELVVRKIANFPAITICAIGHDKDVPLVQLAADYAPSTPTATTVLLSSSWERSAYLINDFRAQLLSRYERLLWSLSDDIQQSGALLESTLEQLLMPFQAAYRQFPALLIRLSRELTKARDASLHVGQDLLSRYAESNRRLHNFLAHTELVLRINDPGRQLKLGYSILSKDGKIVRSIDQIAIGDRFEARVANGTLEGEVKAKHV